EALAEQTDEKQVLAVDTPGRAYREIAELGGLVGGIPALHDAVETLRLIAVAIAFEPFGLDQTAAQRGRGLLALAGDIVFADRPPDAVEHLQRLAIRMQRLALPTTEATRSPDRLDPVLLVCLGDGREAQHFPRLQTEDVADEVVLVQPLHNQEDGARALVV